MTLSRQLILIICGVFLLVFLGTFGISVYNSRIFLTEQLKSHAQDTAYSLGLSVKTALEEHDKILVETMVNAIFDPGYYREIIIKDAHGKTLVERHLPVKFQDIPAWFVKLVPLKTPVATSQFMVGWQPGGTVVVASHPGYAYRQLWYTTEETFWWFLGGIAIALILAVGLLKLVLRPLRAVEGQALAICERDFPVLEKLPRTRELNRVVVAMNTMSRKVEGMLSDQTELTEKMREQANRDAVTGLGNRHNFDGRLTHLVENPEEFHSGALFLMELEGFKEYNNRYGYEAGDDLLRDAGRLLVDAFGSDERNVIARLGGGHFAALARDVGPEETEELARRLVTQLGKLKLAEISPSGNVGYIGVAWFEGERSPTELLSQADMALSAAAAKGANTWHIYDESSLPRDDLHGTRQWLQILRSVIDNRQITLNFQPTLTVPGRTVDHYEVLARIVGENGEPLPAGIFVPMAERHGLMQELDRLVLEKVFEYLHATPAQNAHLAVNLSPASIHDAEFVDWLYKRLEGQALARRLIFEAPEFGTMNDPEGVRSFIHRLRGVGSKFSLDHFGVGFGSFGYLRNLKLDYLKIDGSYIRGINENQDNQFFVRALADIAHGLEIRVIAEAVETEAEWGALAALHVDAAQGYFLGKPEGEIT